MARLPHPGGDAGSWGDVLNDFLSQEHNADGSLKMRSVVEQNQQDISDIQSRYVDVREFGAVGQGDETTQLREALAYAKANRKGLSFRSGVTYTFDSLDLTYTADTPDATIYGYRAVPIRGGGPRATILKQAPGSTAPLLTVEGNPTYSDLSHKGKVLGALIEGFELRGQGIGSGQGVGVSLSIYQYAEIRDCYITEFGSDAIQLHRPVRSVSRDDYSHLFLLSNLKLFRNGGAGVRTPDDHAVGPGVLLNVEASSNTGLGYDLIPSGIEFVNALAFANGGGGLRVRASQNGSPSTAQGTTLFGGRFEGNLNTEILIDGGNGHSLVGVTVFATAAGGFDGVVVGDGTTDVRGLSIFGGTFGGNGVKAGQKAIRLGDHAISASVLNPRVETGEFADSAAAPNDPMNVIALTATSLNTARVQVGSADRTTRSTQAGSSLSTAEESRVYSGNAARWRRLISGQMQYGDGTNPTDTIVDRQAANVWGTASDDSLQAGNGAYNGGHLLMGAYHHWVDGTGRLRIKSGAPTTDTDGTVVGSQT